MVLLNICGISQLKGKEWVFVFHNETVVVLYAFYLFLLVISCIDDVFALSYDDDHELAT